MSEILYTFIQYLQTQELFWRDDQDVESDEVLLKYLSKTLSPSDAKDMLDLASFNSIKAQLTKNTQTAVETYGAFLMPTRIWMKWMSWMKFQWRNWKTNCRKPLKMKITN